MIKAKNILIPLTALFLAACSSPPPKAEDKVRQADHKGSVETQVMVTHLDDNFDLLTTIHQIWYHEAMVNSFVTTDTIPSLGMITTTAQDSAGNSRQVTVPRDYEIYITVK